MGDYKFGFPIGMNRNITKDANIKRENHTMIIRSKAPLRLGIGGGGTDLSPYCDEFGGGVLNATINMYAYCTIEPTNDNKILFFASDRKERFESESLEQLEIDDNLMLHKGVYNRIVQDYNEGKPLSFKMTTYSDAPSGSGLGSSSTMVVAIIKAYMEWLNLPLGEYDMAQLAYKIEREDLGLSGGKQDQYAATFGGFNYIEFYGDGRVIVNPLRIKNWILNELESSLVLYYTGTSRDSAKIIDEQIKSTSGHDQNCLDGMHELKESAISIKECILKGDFEGFSECLRRGWESKKKTSASITNPEIEGIYDFIMANGGKAAKISGAGGGGFMMITCDPKRRFELVEALKNTNKGEVLIEPKRGHSIKGENMKNSTITKVDDFIIRYPKLEICADNILKSLDNLINCYKRGNKLLVCGNGGSATDSQHIVGELMKAFLLDRRLTKQNQEKIRDMFPDTADYMIDNLQEALPAISLVGETALNSAYANDVAPDLSFAQQVLGLGQKGDVLLAISTSGNSANVVYASQIAQVQDMTVIGLTGGTGGRLKEFCDIIINVPAMETYKIQEYHLPIYHVICMALENEFFGENK